MVNPTRTTQIRKRAVFGKTKNKEEKKQCGRRMEIGG